MAGIVRGDQVYVNEFCLGHEGKSVHPVSTPLLHPIESTANKHSEVMSSEWVTKEQQLLPATPALHRSIPSPHALISESVKLQIISPSDNLMQVGPSQSEIHLLSQESKLGERTVNHQTISQLSTEPPANIHFPPESPASIHLLTKSLPSIHLLTEPPANTHLLQGTPSSIHQPGKTSEIMHQSKTHVVSKHMNIMDVTPRFLPTVSGFVINPTKHFIISISSSISHPREPEIDVSCYKCSILSNNTSLQFTYTHCFTPIVFEVENSSPNTRRKVHDRIIIKGNHFSMDSSENIIKFGGYPCVAYRSSARALQCKMDISSEPPTNMWLPLSVRVSRFGKGIISIKKNYKKSAIFQLSLDDIFPTSGSFAGGTRIKLTGTGFNTETIKIFVGSSPKWKPCVIIRKKYNTLFCDTPPCLTCNTTASKQVVIYDTSYQAFRATLTNGIFNFIYDNSVTPKILTVFPLTIDRSTETLHISGVNFGTNVSDINVRVGHYQCSIVLFDSSLGDNTIICSLHAVEAGTYTLVMAHRIYGRALSPSEIRIKSKGRLYMIVPTAGSTYGGTEVRIKGHGFHASLIDVYFGRKLALIMSINQSEIICITPKHTGKQNIFLRHKNTAKYKYNYISVNSNEFSFEISSTPEIQSISPSHGVGGDTLTLQGKFLTATSAHHVKVTVGKVQCVVVSVNATEIKCTLMDHPAGIQEVELNVKGYGQSNSHSFLYDLLVTDVQPKVSGFGGGRLLTITGRGFGNETSINICSSACKIYNVTDIKIWCLSPGSKNYTSSLPDQNCTVKVVQASQEMELPDIYSYKQSMTSLITDINPRISGTGGGVLISIVGTNFLSNANDTHVLIAGVQCSIRFTNSSLITCVTDASKKVSMYQNIKVIFKHQGAAIPVNATFSYIDVWSSIYSWGGTSLPVKGMFLSIFFSFNILYFLYALGVKLTFSLGGGSVK